MKYLDHHKNIQTIINILLKDIIFMYKKMNTTDYAIYGCVGDTRISFGKWYVPVGKSFTEFTYCEWCFNIGCIKIEDIKEVYDSGELGLCTCDCVNDHVKINKYLCNKHYGKNLIPHGTRKCKTPKCRSLTSSKHNKRCRGCSAIFGICEVCG